MIATAICLAVMLGVLGMVFDLGRGFIVKNEAQAFTDSAALTAALRLNGTSAGIRSAMTAVTKDPNKWLMNSRTFASIAIEFSADGTAWSAKPGNAENIRFVKVSAPGNNVTMRFLTALGLPDSVNATATSVAGYQLPASFGQGVFPFAPVARSNDKPHFGYAFGDELALLWPPGAGSNGEGAKQENPCASGRTQERLDAVKTGTASWRGYIMENGADAIRRAIEGDRTNYTVALGQPVERTAGVDSAVAAQSLDARVRQDAFPGESDYASYLRKHSELDPPRPMRRIVMVPIIDSAATAVVRGFAHVFLPAGPSKEPGGAKCAMYIGPASIPVGNTGSGGNTVRLFQ
jgi:Flp pilus assembly protein TadG